MWTPVFTPLGQMPKGTVASPRVSLVSAVFLMGQIKRQSKGYETEEFDTFRQVVLKDTLCKRPPMFLRSNSKHSWVAWGSCSEPLCPAVSWAAHRQPWSPACGYAFHGFSQSL